MCLATLTANKTTRRVGYKVVFLNPDTGEIETGLSISARVPLTGEYTEDPNKKHLVGNGARFKYPAGFHICLDRKDAHKIQGHQGGVVYKVGFRKSVAVGKVYWTWSTGKSLRAETVVAREVRLIGKDTCP